MKRNCTKTTGYQIANILFSALALAAIIAAIFFAKKCIEVRKELKNKDENEIAEMKVHHSDKGILEERDNLLILRK